VLVGGVTAFKVSAISEVVRSGPLVARRVLVELRAAPIADAICRDSPRRCVRPTSTPEIENLR
jgi:hypothetical protein